MKVFKGQAPRWIDGATRFGFPYELDPNYPGTGRLLRATYFRYRGNGLGLIELASAHTIHYDDRLDTRPLLMDPNGAWTRGPASTCHANREMEMWPGHPQFEGWAWNAETHDPNTGVPTRGTISFETTRLGNLIGPSPIQVLGDPEPCQVHGRLFWGRKVLQGGTVVELSQWGVDPNGRSACTRRYNASGPPVQPNVLLSRDVRLTVDWAAGRVVGLTYTGGDPISADPNASGGSGITYRELFSYADGALRTRRHDGVAWYATDQTVDRASGLVTSRRDPSGVTTEMAYDALGRVLVSSTPAPELPTYVTYGAETRTFTDSAGTTNVHTFSRIAELFRGVSVLDPEHIYQRAEFDGLGRLTREVRRNADGSLVQRVRTYDGLDAPTFISVWHHPDDDPSAAPARGWTLSYHDGDPAFPPAGRRDPVGRPTKLTDPTGTVTTAAHFGLNTAVTVRGINGNPNVTATTVVYRDGHGRARVVDAPEGADRLDRYDAAGSLSEVSLISAFTWAPYDDPNTTTADLRADRFAVIPDPGARVQRRAFARDPLGNLRQATEPEKGTTRYHAYDPRGNLLLSEDAGGRLTGLARDPAGRTVRVGIAKDGASPFILRETFSYANATNEAAGSGLALGRMIGAAVYGPGGEWTTDRRLSYGGLNGRLSEERIRDASWAPAAQPWVVTSYAYDAMGLLSRIDYPTPEGSGSAPTQVAYSYQHGFLTRVDANRSGADPGVLTPLLDIAYHPSGGPATWTFANGVVERVSSDAADRPARMEVIGPAGIAWDSGSYAYDGASNLTRIGAQSFSYDKLGRLTSATTASMDPTPVFYGQGFSYDPFGAMTYRTGAPAIQSFAVDPNSGRLNAINAGGANLQFSYSPTGAVRSDGVYDYLLDDRDRVAAVRLKGSGVDLETYAYDDRGWRSLRMDGTLGRSTFYIRGEDGRTLTEFVAPAGGGPHWRKDYIYALGRHVAAVENAEPDEPAWLASEASDPNTVPWVSLTWQAPASPDAHSYNVYRSAAGPAGPYGRLTTVPVIGHGYFDTGANLIEGNPYYYRLTTVDSAAVESRPTAPRRITPGDPAAPPAPQALGARVVETQVELSWTAVPDADGDLAGYRVYRRAEGNGRAGAWVKVSGELSVWATSYLDTTTADGATYAYVVRSLDTAGNESADSPTATVTIPEEDELTDPGKGGKGPGTTRTPAPKSTSLLLPACEPGPAASAAVCLAGENPFRFASHEGAPPAWRLTFYHVDHLGTPRVLTDEAGNVLSRHAFFPYGEEVPGPDPIALSENTHWFTGHERDVALGADYMLARYYSPWSARFRSPDPLSPGFHLGGQSSLYAYAVNTPLLAVDPSGESHAMDYCLQFMYGTIVSIGYGLGTIVTAIDPKLRAVSEALPVIGGSPVELAYKTVASGVWAVNSFKECTRRKQEDEVITFCVDSGTKETCERAVEICNLRRQPTVAALGFRLGRRRGARLRAAERIRSRSVSERMSARSALGMEALATSPDACGSCRWRTGSARRRSSASSRAKAAGNWSRVPHSFST